MISVFVPAMVEGRGRRLGRNLTHGIRGGGICCTLLAVVWAWAMVGVGSRGLGGRRRRLDRHDGSFAQQQKDGRDSEGRGG